MHARTLSALRSSFLRYRELFVVLLGLCELRGEGLSPRAALLEQRLQRERLRSGLDLRRRHLARAGLGELEKKIKKHSEKTVRD